MKIHLMEQGSDLWFAIRKGVPTASNFHRIITPAKRKYSSQAEDYILELIGDKFSEIPPEGVENFTNRAVRWGEWCEGKARDYFRNLTNLEVTQVGFVTTDDGRFGCSPDGLIPNSGLELKCPQAKTQVEWLMAGVLPEQHKTQVHGCMIVCDVPEWWFLSYSPGLPPLLLNVKRDSFTDDLQVALEMFHEKYQAALERFKSM